MSGWALDLVPFKIIPDVQATECLTLCKSDINCRSVNVDYTKRACHLIAEDSRLAGRERFLKESPNYNYFEKICLNVNKTCIRDWAFERVPGHELVGYNQEKTVIKSTTREECEAACLRHAEFECRSAEFNIQLSECRLNPYNRFSSNDKKIKLKESDSGTDYFENNCASGLFLLKLLLFLVLQILKFSCYF